MQKSSILQTGIKYIKWMRYCWKNVYWISIILTRKLEMTMSDTMDRFVMHLSTESSGQFTGSKMNLSREEPWSFGEKISWKQSKILSFTSNVCYCGSGTLSVRALGDPKLGDPSECHPTLQASRSKTSVLKAKIEVQYTHCWTRV